MKRRHVHAAFALASAVVAALVVGESLSVHRATQLALVAAGNPDVAPDLPEAQLMRALAMAGEDRFEDALAELKPLTRTDDPTLRSTALYDLGNLHLREGLRRHATTPEEALPYIELAKQYYRDVLRQRPGDWDARYNLERALWLAPEEEQVAMEAAPPVPSERAITTMRGGKAALP